MKGINALELYLEGQAKMIEGKSCPKCNDIIVRINLTGDVKINNIICVDEECDYKLEVVK